MPENENVENQGEYKQEENKDTGWDKERQRVDQLQANFTKLASEKSELTDRLASMTEQSSGLVAKVEALEQKLVASQEQQQEIDDSLDPDMYDETLIKAMSTLKSEISDTKKKLQDSNAQVQSLLSAKDRYETEQQDKVNKQRKANAKEEILSGLDAKYGAKFRNEAVRLAQANIDKTGEAPKDALSVYLLLEKQYLSLAKNPSSVHIHPSIPVDTGEGGIVFNEGDIPEGTREDVLTKIMAKFKDKPFTMPST